MEKIYSIKRSIATFYKYFITFFEIISFYDEKNPFKRLEKSKFYPHLFGALTGFLIGLILFNEYKLKRAFFSLIYLILNISLIYLKFTKTI